VQDGARRGDEERGGGRARLGRTVTSSRATTTAVVGFERPPAMQADDAATASVTPPASQAARDAATRQPERRGRESASHVVHRATARRTRARRSTPGRRTASRATSDARHVARGLAGEAQVGGEVGIGRDQAPGALVGEHRAADVAGLQVRVAEVVVDGAALDAAGEDLLVRRGGLGIAPIAVEAVGPG
jgi:hypothetical protein